MKKMLAMLFCFGAVLSYAQETSLDLDPVTVTSSIQAKRSSETGRNILSFKGEEFSRLPIHSLDDLLRYLPGLEVQQRGPLGAQSDIVIRGGTFQQVLVLIDGIRVNDPNTGHFNGYIPIAPAEIDHVEVLKGAASAIYGSEAVGGVIHIITKAFKLNKRKQQPQASASLEAGEHSLLAATASLFLQGDKSALSIGAISNNTGGDQQRGIRGFVHNNTVSMAYSYAPNKRWQLSFRSAFDNRDFAAQNFYTSFVSDTAREEVQTWWNQAAISYTGERHRISLDLGYKKVKDEYLFNKVSIANLNKSDLMQATLMDEWTLKPGATLVSGLQFMEKEIRSNDRGDHDLGQVAAFLLLNQSLGQHWSIHPALRVDHNARSGTELIPQLSISFKDGRFQYRGMVGKTTRDADFTERFNNYNKPVVSSGRIGDPELEAEKSLSYEAGVDFYASKGLKLSGTAFQRLHRKLIDYVTTPYADMPRKDNLVVGGTYALAKNIARVNTAGIELDAQYNQAIGNRSNLYAGLGILWLSSHTSEGNNSFYISSHAKLLGNFYLRWQIADLTVSINGVYKQRGIQKASAINASLSHEYFVLNSRIAYGLCRQRLSLFIGANNLFDKDYSDLLGAPMPGRWISGGLSVSLGR